MATTQPKDQVFIHNVATNETNVRDITANEIAQREIDATEAAAQVAAIEAKAAARQSALAKLAELGLTEEEIQAL